MVDFVAIPLFALCALLLLLSLKLQIEKWTAAIVLSIYALKCVIGYSLLKYYSVQGGGDMLNYLQQSAQLASLIRDDPSLVFSLFHETQPAALNELKLWSNWHYAGMFNDNRIFLLYLALCQIITAGNALGIIVISNFLSLSGLLAMLRSLKLSVAEWERKPAYVLLLLPSVLLWTSGLFKECLQLFFMGQLFLAIVADGKYPGLKTWLFGLLSMLVKPYLMLVLLPGIACIYWSRRKPNISLSKLFFYVYAGGLIDLLILGYFIPAINLPEYLFGQQLNMIRNAIVSGAATFVDVTHFAPAALSFLKHLPEAVAFAFFRPWPMESGLWWTLPFGMESVFVAMYVCWALLTTPKVKMSAMHFLCFYAALALFMLLGFTIPVLGNLVRLRVPAIFFLAIVAYGLKSHSDVKLAESD